jgi:hypothetical protein
MSNILLTDVQILTEDNLFNEQYVELAEPIVNILLTDIGIPVHDNLVITELSLNINSPSNEGILPVYENVDIISPIPIGDGNIFSSDPAQLPQIVTLNELLRYLSEVMLRFNSNPDYYLQDDFSLLIKTLSNSLIHLYLSEEVTNTYTAIPGVVGISNLNTNPVQEAFDINHRFPGIYLANSIGNYTNFGITISQLEIDNAVVLLIPNIIDNTFINYTKEIYKIDLSGVIQDKYYRFTQNTTSSV